MNHFMWETLNKTPPPPPKNVHPWRLTWNIIMEVSKIIFLSKWKICRFHDNLRGCTWRTFFPWDSTKQLSNYHVLIQNLGVAPNHSPYCWLKSYTTWDVFENPINNGISTTNLNWCKRRISGTHQPYYGNFWCPQLREIWETNLNKNGGALRIHMPNTGK